MKDKIQIENLSNYDRYQKVDLIYDSFNKLFISNINFMIDLVKDIDFNILNKVFTSKPLFQDSHKIEEQKFNKAS
jgi:sulfatase maturation enzyme AslB (radical SAM superfamily)